MNSIVITPDLLDQISQAAKISDFAKEKLESARKSYDKVKDQINLGKSHSK